MGNEDDEDIYIYKLKFLNIIIIIIFLINSFFKAPRQTTEAQLGD